MSSSAEIERAVEIKYRAERYRQRCRDAGRDREQIGNR